MIWPKNQGPDQPRDNLVLAISIERPSEQFPEGYVCMTAHVKSIDPEHPAIAFEDATDGPLTTETVEALIRDVRSYVANGKKSAANDARRKDDRGFGIS